MNTSTQPDLILHNGRITTLDPKYPEANNLAVKDRYGKKAAERTPPVRRMLELGLPVGAGTDSLRWTVTFVVHSTDCAVEPSHLRKPPSAGRSETHSQAASRGNEARRSSGKPRGKLRLPINLGGRDDLVAERQNEGSRGFQPTVRRRTGARRCVATVERRCRVQPFRRRYATPNRVGGRRPQVETRGYHHSLAPRGSRGRYP
jgi:hypothetical protein